MSSSNVGFIFPLNDLMTPAYGICCGRSSLQAEWYQTQIRRPGGRASLSPNSRQPLA